MVSMRSLQNYKPGLKSKTSLMTFLVILPFLTLCIFGLLAAFYPHALVVFFTFTPSNTLFVILLFLNGLALVPVARMILYYRKGRFCEAHLSKSKTPFLVTKPSGEIVYSNHAFSSQFPDVSSNLDELSVYLKDHKSRDCLQNFVKDAWSSSSKDERSYVFSADDDQDTALTLRPHREGNVIYWTFDAVLSSAPFKVETEFQRALDVMYLFNATASGNIVLDDKGCIQGMNETFKEKFLKHTKAPIGSAFIDLLAPSCVKEMSGDIVSLLQAKEKGTAIELEFSWGDNVIAYLMPIAFGQTNGKEKDNTEELPFKGFYLQIFDNTEQRNIQLRLAHSQKLQALGQLAGGIAHDFNNLLTAMIGFCDLLLMRLSPGDQSFTDIMQIKQNANRATNLVRQLLAFSRQQTLQPTVLDVSEVLSDLSILLQRLIGSQIELKIVHDREVDYIKVDRSQFEQVIVNLVVNAKDAIIGEGTVKVISKLVSFEKPTLVDHETMPAGSYIQIEVIDDGQGISRKNLQRIFDPFFSTKDVGEGTGLGLATVYGTVKQTGGHINVDSTVGVGTKFTILLPQHIVDKKAQTGTGSGSHESVSPSSAASLSSESSTQPFQDLTGKGHILLAEDEDAVRLFAARALTDKGYTVEHAQNGQEALMMLQERVEQNLPAPDLLITDVVMPKMDGPTLVKEAEVLYPDLKVMYISGYAEDAFRDMVRLEERIRFLAKPFSLKVLAARVKETMVSNTQDQGPKDTLAKDESEQGLHVVSNDT